MLSEEHLKRLKGKKWGLWWTHLCSGANREPSSHNNSSCQSQRLVSGCRQKPDVGGWRFFLSTAVLAHKHTHKNKPHCGATAHIAYIQHIHRQCKSWLGCDVEAWRASNSKAVEKTTAPKTIWLDKRQAVSVCAWDVVLDQCQLQFSCRRPVLHKEKSTASRVNRGLTPTLFYIFTKASQLK